MGSWLSVKCKAHEVESVFRCETHSHKWGRVQGMKPNDSQVHFHFGGCTRAKVVNVQNLGWKGRKIPNWTPQDTIRKVLKRRCLKCACIVYLNLIYMNYDQKKGGSQIENLTPKHKSLEWKNQMRSNWSVLYTVEKIFSRAIRYCCCTLKIDLIWERYECPKFWDNKNPSFGTLTLESQGKVTFGCSPRGEA